MPVRSVGYRVSVDGSLAEVHIQQVFVNDSDESIDAVYVFPLYEEVAVDSLRIFVGEALDGGHAAALTTQEPPDVLAQPVGHIPPGEEVRVELSVVQPVPRVDGTYELVLPLAVAPRLLSLEEWQARGTAHGRPLLGPLLAEPGAALTAGIEVEVDSGQPFESMHSPSHEVLLSGFSWGSRALAAQVPLDRDFVLRWSVIGAVAADEHAYPLAGAVFTDPVTGTFSLNVTACDVRPSEGLDAARMPAIVGTMGPETELESAPGTNDLEMSLRASRLSRLGQQASLSAEQLSGRLSGPLLRDRLWAVGGYRLDRSALREGTSREFLGHSGSLKLTAQPSLPRRLSLAGTAERSAVEVSSGEVGAQTRQDSALGTARWQWFLSADAYVTSGVHAQEQRLAGDVRRQVQGWSHLSVSEIDDPMGGRHALGLGADFERSDWTLTGGWAAPWLGVAPMEQARLLRAGAFAQDSYKPWISLSLHGGARVDVALGRAHVGPRLYGVWEPWGRRRTRIALGFARVYGQLGLPSAVIEPERGLARLDEGLLLAERELLWSLVLGVEGLLQARSGLPVHGGGRTEQRSWSSRLFLRKLESRRWSAQLSWRYARLLDPEAPIAPWLDDGSLAGFTHTALGQLAWELPTDTRSLGLTGGLHAEPIGTLLPDPNGPALPNVPRWSGGARFAHTIGLRQGQLVLEVEALYLALLDDPRDLSWAWVQAPLLEQPGWQGPRLQLAASYQF